MAENQRCFFSYISLKCLLPTLGALVNHTYKAEILRLGDSEPEFKGHHTADTRGKCSWRCERSGPPTFQD